MKNISLLDRIGTSQDPVQREKLQILQGQIETLCEEIDQILSTGVSLDPPRGNAAPRDDGAGKRAEAKERAEAEARAAEEKKQAEAKARAAAQAAAPAQAAQAAPRAVAPQKPALSPEMEEAKAAFKEYQITMKVDGKGKVDVACNLETAAQAGVPAIKLIMDAKQDGGNVTMNMSLHVANLCEGKLTLTQTWGAATQTPEDQPPEGSTVVDAGALLES